MRVPAHIDLVSYDAAGKAVAKLALYANAAGSPVVIGGDDELTTMLLRIGPAIELALEQARRRQGRGERRKNFAKARR